MAIRDDAGQGRWARPLVLLALLSLGTAGWSADFQRLGDLPGGTVGSMALDVSGDGSVVVGASQGATGQQPFRWTAAGGLSGLAGFGTGRSPSSTPASPAVANGVSRDGRFVAGTSPTAGSSMDRAFIWSEGSGFTFMVPLPPGPGDLTRAYAVSDGGGVVVGQGNSMPGGFPIATRWVRIGSSYSPRDDVGGFRIIRGEGRATDVNSDGTVIVGWSTTDIGVEAFRYTAESPTAFGVSVGLGDLPGGVYQSRASGVSRDGNIVVGESTSAAGREAFRWTQATGMVGLGDLSGGAFSSSAAAVSADGSVVVGTGTTADGERAFRWTSDDGMQSVAEWLADSGVAVADGFELRSATSVSDDGSVVVGTGVSASSPTVMEAYFARAESGAVSLATLSESLASANTGSGGASTVSSTVLNGAHHRPLMAGPELTAESCIWSNADAGRDRRDNSYFVLGEVGVCHDFASNVRAGVAIGASTYRRDTAFAGDTDMNGQYVYGEVNWQPSGALPLVSVSTLYGSWDTDVVRGYLNAGLFDASRGDTESTVAAARLRFDWVDAWSVGRFAVTPKVEYTFSHARTDAYTELGGGFPARFDRQSHSAHEVRAGVTGKTDLNDRTALSLRLDGVRRFDSAGPGVSGQVIGAFGFSLAGEQTQSTWLRVGAEVDHRLAPNMVLSASLNAATRGEDPDLSGALSLRMAF